MHPYAWRRRYDVGTRSEYSVLLCTGCYNQARWRSVRGSLKAVHVIVLCHLGSLFRGVLLIRGMCTSFSRTSLSISHGRFEAPVSLRIGGSTHRCVSFLSLSSLGFGSPCVLGVGHSPFSRGFDFASHFIRPDIIGTDSTWYTYLYNWPL